MVDMLVKYFWLMALRFPVLRDWHSKFEYSEKQQERSGKCSECRKKNAAMLCIRNQVRL